jgi:hypothetical protein
MNNENNNHDEDDFEMPKLDIRQENEFKKMKMNLEHGAIFPNDLSKQLPPEIEGQFLDSIMSFEKAFRNAKKISVYDKIGRPDFVPENVLNDHEVKESLEKIEFILRQNGLNLDVLADYQDEERLIYKFITEELFNVEVDDVRVPGFNTNFIYEEFHQNHKYDLERDTLDFLTMFLNKKSDFYDEFHSKDAANHIELNNFRSLFKKLKLKLFEINEIVFDEQNAKTTFSIDFWGKVSGIENKIFYSGEGTMTFEYKGGYWCLVEVKLPINS